VHTEYELQRSTGNGVIMLRATVRQRRDVGGHHTRVSRIIHMKK